MIGKLKSLFFWSALSTFVCVGFSGTVVANETTECRLASYIDLSQFPLSSQAKLRKILPSTITKRPRNIRDLNPRLFVDWKSRGNTWIADVEIGKLIVRYKCDGPAAYLGRIRGTVVSDSKKPKSSTAKIRELISCERYALPPGFLPEYFPETLDVTSRRDFRAWKVKGNKFTVRNNRGNFLTYTCTGPAWQFLYGHLTDAAICKRSVKSPNYRDEVRRRDLNCEKIKDKDVVVSATSISENSIVEADQALSQSQETWTTAAAPTSVAPSVSSTMPQTPSASASKPPPVEDAIPPTISIASNTANGPQAKIEGRVFDEAGIAEVIIDGSTVSLGGDGSFTASFYIPRSGKTVEIVAFDSKGNKATKSLVLERGQMQNATGPSFASLNPSGKRVKPNQDALALIIGVADYERTPARAAYADKDAQTFYDYAMLKLGIPATNIKELVNADANEAEVRLAVKDWIARSTRQGQSDVYVFFAGHGLANQSGDDMYLLPVDGEPRLLSDTAIARERLFADIAAAKPRSVTVFLDTCYSGTTRGTDMLIASRPIAIRAKEQAIPEGFTVMTAAAGDQTAKPLEEAKHGMFSYFLMKGMEGDADTNQDNQITAGELYTYVQQNVIQQSSGSQTPELQGDANRVLVRFQ